MTTPQQPKPTKPNVHQPSLRALSSSSPLSRRKLPMSRGNTFSSKYGPPRTRGGSGPSASSSTSSALSNSSSSSQSDLQTQSNSSNTGQTIDQVLQHLTEGLPPQIIQQFSQAASTQSNPQNFLLQSLLAFRIKNRLPIPSYLQEILGGPATMGQGPPPPSAKRELSAHDVHVAMKKFQAPPPKSYQHLGKEFAWVWWGTSIVTSSLTLFLVGRSLFDWGSKQFSKKASSLNS